jgi:lipoprotein
MCFKNFIMFRNTILLINFYHFSFACMKLFYIFAVYSKNVKPLSVFGIEEYLVFVVYFKHQSYDIM